MSHLERISFATIFLVAAGLGMRITTWPVFLALLETVAGFGDAGWPGSVAIVGGTAYLVALGLLVALPGDISVSALAGVSGLGLLVACLALFAVPVDAPSRIYGALVTIGLLVSVIRWRAWTCSDDVQASAV